MSGRSPALPAIAADDPADHAELIVRPHHFDRLRLDARHDDAGRIRRPLETALTWNVFRALELLPPAFWLRRLNARLGLDPPTPAASLVRVSLWPELMLAPAAIAGGAPRSARVDVLIETEHAVWAMLVCHGGDVVRGSADLAGIDPLALAAQAASEAAGRRPAYIAIVVNVADEAPIGLSLVDKYSRSVTALALRAESANTAGALGNVAGFGATRWSALRLILGECARCSALTSADRALAAGTEQWLGCALEPRGPAAAPRGRG